MLHIVLYITVSAIILGEASTIKRNPLFDLYYTDEYADNDDSTNYLATNQYEPVRNGANANDALIVMMDDEDSGEYHITSSRSSESNKEDILAPVQKKSMRTKVAVNDGDRCNRGIEGKFEKEMIQCVAVPRFVNLTERLNLTHDVLIHQDYQHTIVEHTCERANVMETIPNPCMKFPQIWKHKLCYRHNPLKNKECEPRSKPRIIWYKKNQDGAQWHWKKAEFNVGCGCDLMIESSVSISS